MQSWTCSSLRTVAEFVKLTQGIVIEIQRQSCTKSNFAIDILESSNAMVGKKGNLVMRFVENLTTWREILTFDIKEYIRIGGKCNYIPWKNAFFQTLLERKRFFIALLHAHFSLWACEVERNWMLDVG